MIPLHSSRIVVYMIACRARVTITVKSCRRHQLIEPSDTVLGAQAARFALRGRVCRTSCEVYDGTSRGISLSGQSGGSVARPTFQTMSSKESMRGSPVGPQAPATSSRVQTSSSQTDRDDQLKAIGEAARTGMLQSPTLPLAVALRDGSDLDQPRHPTGGRAGTADWELMSLVHSREWAPAS